MLRFRFLLLITTILISIFSENSFAQSSFDRLVYSYSDGAIPPMYYRTYQIEVDKKGYLLTVKDYEKTLNTKKGKLTAKKWANLRMDYSKLEAVASEVPMTGTKGYSLEFFQKGASVKKLTWTSGDKANPKLEAYAKKVQAVVPDLETKLMRAK
jgi:hypothetical protein